MLSSKAQDTTCTYFAGKEVYEFDYQMDTILWWEKQTTKFYDTDKNLIEDVPTGISKGQKVVAIIKPKYVWINSGKFGVTWVASQICLKGGANDNDFPECVLSDDE